MRCVHGLTAEQNIGALVLLLVGDGADFFVQWRVGCILSRDFKVGDDRSGLTVRRNQRVDINRISGDRLFKLLEFLRRARQRLQHFAGVHPVFRTFDILDTPCGETNRVLLDGFRQCFDRRLNVTNLAENVRIVNVAFFGDDADHRNVATAEDGLEFTRSLGELVILRRPNVRVVVELEHADPRDQKGGEQHGDRQNGPPVAYDGCGIMGDQ